MAAPPISSATPMGLLNCALVPVPSVLPQLVLPASVATAPLAVVMRRSSQFRESAMYSAPLVASMANPPMAELSCAALPVPSVEPHDPAVPATVLTAPLATTTLRTVQLPRSPTYSTPLVASSARARGPQ